MRCSSPVTITNRKLAYHSGYDRPKSVVPCNCCDACRENIKNSWIVRIYYHWKHFYEAGGIVLFVTLTYRNACLPYVHDGDFHFSCFSYKDIKRWLNSVRKYLEVHFGVVGMDYIVTCEYGTAKNGTKRPHYHVMLFFPPSKGLPTVPVLKQIVEYYWRGPLYRKDENGEYKPIYLIDQLQGYDLKGRSRHRGKFPKRMGFVYWSKKSTGAEVTLPQCSKYVGKYICKDLGFYEKEEIKKYLSIEGNKEKIKDKLPRHWQSHSFGLSILDHILSLPYREQLEAIEKGVTFASSAYYYTLPKYIENKLYYEHDPLITEIDGQIYKQRVLSARGLQYKKDLIDRSLRRVEDDLRVALSPFGLSRYFPTSSVLVRWCRSHRIYGVYDHVDLSNYLVDRYIKPFSFKDLAAYKVAYRSFAYNYYVFNGVELKTEVLTMFAPCVLDDRLQFNYEAYDFEPDDRSQVYVDQHNLLLNYVYGYKEFEDLLCLLDDMASLSSERKMNVIVRDEEIIDEIKSKLVVYDEE